MANRIGWHFLILLQTTTGSDNKKPVMKHILNPQMLRTWNPINYFNQFFLWGYIWLHVIPATNEALKEINRAKTTIPKIKTWLGIWFLMSLNGQYAVDNLMRLKQKVTNVISSTLLNAESIYQKQDSRGFYIASD